MKKIIYIFLIVFPFCLFLATPTPSQAALNLQEGEGIDLTSTGVGGTLTVSGENATPTNKGIASFDDDDFSVSSGAVSIDYTNGQTASSTLKGFLSASDWSTFNSKQAALGFTPVNAADWTSIDNYPDACGSGGFVTGLGDTLTCGTPITSVWSDSSGDVSNLVAGPGDSLDASDADSTKPMIVVEVCPETCTVGDMCFDLDATAGYNVFGCTSEDVWTLQGTNVSTSPWGATGTDVYLAVPTNDVVIGGITTLSGAKFAIDGDSNQVQAIIQGHSSQTEKLLILEKYDGTDVFSVDNDGTITTGDGTVGGSWKPKEKASADSATAGYGEFWVRSDTPNVPMFTNDAGTDGQLLTPATAITQINWTLLDELVLNGINWDDYLGGGSEINWAAITEVDLPGINWESYELGDGINWAAITETKLTGINWDDYAGGTEINWSSITELMLDGINWADYENADINWSTITESTLDGINWEDYGTAGINWDDITTSDLTGINWVDLDTTHPAEMADADFGAFTCSSGTCSLDSFVLYLRPQQAKLPASGAAAINPAGNALWTILFDDDDTECVYWAGTFLRPFSGTLKTKLAYKAYSATSGTMELELSAACVSDGDSDDDSPTFGTADSLSATVPGTAGILDILADTSLEGDSCATDDLIYIKLCRDADDGTNDTATGDMEFTGGVVYAE